MRTTNPFNRFWAMGLGLLLYCCTGLQAQIIPCIDISLIDTTVVCPTIFQPVCGCDGVTYPNACVATNYHGVSILAIGPCPITCNADFAWSNSQLCTTTGKCIQFTDQSSNNVIGWAWNFGDGGTSNAQNPTHSYQAPGKYTVCLTVVAIGPQGNACTDVHCDTIRVACKDTSLIDSSMVCPLFILPVCGCDGVTYDGPCQALYYGGVCFWVPGPCPVDPCQADFDWVIDNSGPIINGNTVDFTNTSTGYPILGQFWDFGDGSFSTLANPSHNYTRPGKYEVCLTIGCDPPFGPSILSTFCDTIIVPCIDSNLIGPGICPAIYQPVCGCNGQDYANACIAQNHGVSAWKPGPCPFPYCFNYAENPWIGWITQVGPNYTGNNGGYALFNFCNFTLQAASTVLIPLNAGVNNPPPGAVAHWRVWVDYNQDDDFNDPGELAWQGVGALNPTAVVTIDPNACLGCTRFRFQLSGQFMGPCGAYGAGETEDYNVTIINDIACGPNKSELEIVENPFVADLDEIVVQVFPNPASSQAQVVVELGAETEDLSIAVYDIEGKAVHSVDYAAMTGRVSIDLPVADLANGMYQVQVRSGSGVNIEKLVIAR